MPREGKGEGREGDRQREGGEVEVIVGGGQLCQIVSGAGIKPLP
jgi:hypothetical protein